MRKQTKDALDNIMDCISGSDGGVKFALFLGSLGNIDKQAEDGDKSSEELINIMLRFSRMIDIFSEREEVIGEGNKSNEKGNRERKKRVSRKT